MKSRVQLRPSADQGMGYERCRRTLELNVCDYHSYRIDSCLGSLLRLHIPVCGLKDPVLVLRTG